MIITSNRGFRDWGGVFGDNVVASPMRWLYAFMRRRRSQDGNGPRAPNCLSR